MTVFKETMKALTSLDLGLMIEEGREEDLTSIISSFFFPVARVMLYIGFNLPLFMYLFIYFFFNFVTKSHSVAQAGSNLKYFHLSPLSVRITGSTTPSSHWLSDADFWYVLF